MMEVALPFFAFFFFFLTYIYACPRKKIPVKSLQIEEPISFFVEMNSELFLNHGKVELMALAWL